MFNRLPAHENPDSPAYISPRPGATPHRLTIEAARNMLALVERAAHYKTTSEGTDR